MKNLLLSNLGPPWFAGWHPQTEPRPFFGWLRGSGGPRVRTERLAAALGNSLFSPNIIYSSSAGLVPLGTMERVRRRGFRGPVIHNQNGLYFPAWYQGDCASKNAELARFVFHADYVIFQSAFCLEAFRKLVPGTKLPPHEVLLNPSPDLEAGAPAPRKGSPQFLVAGNLGHGGAHVLHPALRFFARAGKSLDASMLVLATPSKELLEEPATKSLLSAVEAAGLSDRLRFLSYTPQNFRTLLTGRPIALHLRYKDSCPNAVSEKLSLGIPHIYSGSGGTPELVGPAGIALPVEDSWDQLLPVSDLDLEQAAQRVLAKYDELSWQARKEFETRLTFEAYMKRHEQLFDRALRGAL